MGNLFDSPLARVDEMPKERRVLWQRVREQLDVCSCQAGGAESAAYEEGIQAEMGNDTELCSAVSVDGWSWMHGAASWARTEDLVRFVWKHCGKQARKVMRHSNNSGNTVLLCLALNPNMTRGMYAVFAERFTEDDLRAANDHGWTVLLTMAVTFARNVGAEEQEENIASVMCAVAERLGPDALLAQSTKAFTYYGPVTTTYPAGSTPRSILQDAGEKGGALLQRLEEAAGLLEGGQSTQAGDMGNSPTNAAGAPTNAQSITAAEDTAPSDNADERKSR